MEILTGKCVKLVLDAEEVVCIETDEVGDVSLVIHEGTAIRLADAIARATKTALPIVDEVEAN